MLAWQQAAVKSWSCLEPMDVYSLHIRYPGSGKHLTLVSWSIWWKNNTSENNEFSIVQTAESIHIVTTQLQNQGMQNQEVRESRTAPFSSCPSLNQLNHILCAWLHEQHKPGGRRDLWKGWGLHQPHSAISFFLLVPTIITNYTRQIWKVKCKIKISYFRGVIWPKTQKRDRNVTTIT